MVGEWVHMFEEQWKFPVLGQVVYLAHIIGQFVSGSLPNRSWPTWLASYTWSIAEVVSVCMTLSSSGYNIASCFCTLCVPDRILQEVWFWIQTQVFRYACSKHGKMFKSVKRFRAAFSALERRKRGRQLLAEKKNQKKLLLISRKMVGLAWNSKGTCLRDSRTAAWIECLGSPGTEDVMAKSIPDVLCCVSSAELWRVVNSVGCDGCLRDEGNHVQQNFLKNTAGKNVILTTIHLNKIGRHHF